MQLQTMHALANIINMTIDPDNVVLYCTVRRMPSMDRVNLYLHENLNSHAVQRTCSGEHPVRDC